jgi:hypothetical protein
MAAVKDRGAHLTQSAVVKWSGDMRLTVAIEHGRTAGRPLAGQHPRGHIHQRGPICICPEADRRLARGAAGPAIHLQVVASFGRQKIYRGDRTKLSLCQDSHLRKIGQTVHRRATVQSLGPEGCRGAHISDLVTHRFGQQVIADIRINEVKTGVTQHQETAIRAQSSACITR